MNNSDNITMATIKFYPPKQLPSEGVSDSAFNIWVEETEVYLDLDPRFQKFLPGGSLVDTRIGSQLNQILIGLKL